MGEFLQGQRFGQKSFFGPFPSPNIWRPRGVITRLNTQLVAIAASASRILAISDPSGDGNVYQSNNGGASWSVQGVLPAFTGPAVWGRLLWGSSLHRVWILPLTQNTSPLGTPTVLRSTTAGVSWTVISLVAAGLIRTLNLASVGTDDGTHWIVWTGVTPTAVTNNFAISSDGGATWTVPASFSNFGSPSSQIIWDGTVFATLVNASSNTTTGLCNLIRSTDFGATWTVVGSVGAARQLAYDPLAKVYYTGSATGTIRVSGSLAGLVTAADRAIFPIPSGYLVTDLVAATAGSTNLIISATPGFQLNFQGSPFTVTANSFDGNRWALDQINWPVGEGPTDQLSNAVASFCFDPASQRFQAAGSAGSVFTWPP